jgi:hypothetical protein
VVIFPLVPAVSLVLLLVAAKAHGRQVRLERERAGYHEVVFGGENPPFVEALWRRDRVGYWTVVPAAALVLGAAAWRVGAGWAWLLTAVLLWAPTMGFVALGLASLGRLLRGAGSQETEEKERRRAAVRGSVAWWGAAGLLALAVALLAWLA